MEPHHRVHPAVAFATNMILDRFGLQPEPRSSAYPELGEVPVISGLRRKHGAVVLNLGRRESGKTVMSHRLAEIIGRPTFTVSPEQKPPSWITELSIESLDKMPPPYSTLIMDDIAVTMSSRDYMNAYVQFVEKLIPVVRHKRKLILIFNSQTAGQADKWVLDADLILLKAPNPLYEDLERRAVVRVYKKLVPMFDSMSDYQIHKHAYLYSTRYKGLVSINMPANYEQAQGSEVVKWASS